MTNKTSGIAFTVCLLLALLADSMPLWALFGAVVSLVAVTAVLALTGLARGKFTNVCEFRHKKTAPGAANTRSGKTEQITH